MVKWKKRIGYGSLILLGMLCVLYIQMQKNSMPSQLFAERFRNGEERFAQVSAFYTIDARIYETDISNYRSRIQKSLEEASLKAKNPNARLWLDCYSGEAKTVAGRNLTTQKISLIGIGGDYFLFHPVTLLS